MKTQVVQGKIRSFAFDKLECSEDTNSKGASQARKIRGFANKNVVDRANERIDPSAFLSSKEKFMTNPIMFYNHDWDTPVGKITSLDVTPEGLFVEAEVATGFNEADKVWTMVQQGILKSFSIGFRTKKIMFDVEEDAHIITDLELLEVSIVTIPENADSLFEVAKSGSISGISVKSPADDSSWISYKSLISGDFKEVTQVKEEYIKPVITVEDAVCSVCSTEKKSIELGVHPCSKSEFICYDCFGGAFGHTKKSIDYEKEIDILNQKIKSLESSLDDTKSKLESKQKDYDQLFKSYQDILITEIEGIAKELIKN